MSATAECTYVRLIHYANKNTVRYEYGEYHNDIKTYESNPKDNNISEDFINASIYYKYGYQIDIAVTNHQYARVNIQNHHEHLDSSRRSELSSTLDSNHFELMLFHHQSLPEFLCELADESEWITDLSNANKSLDATLQHESKQLDTLLNTIVISIEGIQLINDYQTITSDSLTKLQSRSSLQRAIDEQISTNNIALCMVHCIDFQQVNRKFGQAKGDKVLREIADIINKYTRSEDISCRFGGALFGIAISASSISEGYKLAVKLQNAMHERPYLHNAIRLSFSVGVAFIHQQDVATENVSASNLLINRAEQALKAAQGSNTPSIVQWEADKFTLDEQEFNYFGGIFTPDNVTNYRNMLLLWDISSIIADETDFAQLLKSVVERLAYTFEFQHAGIVSTAGNTNYTYALSQNGDISETDFEQCEYQQFVSDSAVAAVKQSRHVEYEQDKHKTIIIPLGTNNQDCLFIIGQKDLLALTHESIMLFVGFARQLGKALKRSQLEDQLNKRLEHQNAVLAEELSTLKAGMQSSALVFSSKKMQRVMEHTQRAAQSEATVLVTGESGTGKEKLIHALHSLGPRAKQPLVIVDCGSIPETLIESELFGHVKGAFTGAQTNSTGKIQAADGGLLVLDEIGELPISMQPKLLRFVQEKHITPIGGNRAIQVDVKIVAVTNRDLAYEVSKGKFRQDLYYRLNVLSLHSPPLRDRPEDIPLLCQHFLSKFAHQFNIDKKHLPPHTIELMQAYDWPGNIRELENKLMQASLLSANTELSYDDLQLGNSVNPHNNDAIRPINTASMPAPVGHTAVDNITRNQERSNAYLRAPHEDTAPSTSADAILDWQAAFNHSINKLILEIGQSTTRQFSLGIAIEAHLLHKTYLACPTHNKTALRLHLPVSTTRRRLMKLGDHDHKFSSSENWLQVSSLLQQIVSQDVPLDKPMQYVKNATARGILQVHQSNMTLAAKMMGVSEPTMYKYRKTLS
ncbi:MAG: sigma 54-interacting transcriptional regulator [Glaciecola sp.]